MAAVPVARVMTAPTNTIDYLKVLNKPRIEDVELVGNRMLAEFGIGVITNADVDNIFGF